MRALAALAVVALAAVPACSSPRPATEMIVDVDGDEGVRMRTASVRVEVFGRASVSQPFLPDPFHESSHAVPLAVRWGPRVVVFPEGRDPLRGYRVVAIALDGDGEEITRTSVISGYVEGVSLHFRLFLQSSCEGVECDELETCRDGTCADAYVDPRDLLDGGTDLDAGPRDAATPDAPLGCDDCNDGMACTTDRCVDDVCVHDVACDDGIECTMDRCGAGGACENMPMDSLCTDGTECEAGACDVGLGRCVYTGDDDLCDDSNPCTADVCGGAGCVFPALTGASCSDGMYCNGLETCDGGGVCQPAAGTVCPGASVCNEDMDRCTGCVGESDCPADSTSYGACDYTSLCDETAMRPTTTTMHACVAGICQPSETSGSEPCTRTTTGDSCPGSSCGSYSCGGFADACDSSGTEVRTCVDYACAAGSCAAGTPRTEMGSTCPRPTEGLTCGAMSCGPGYCMYTSVCSTNGVGLHDCNTSRCRSDVCRPESYTEPDPLDCNRTTEGNSCLGCGMCRSGGCDLMSCDGGVIIDAGWDAPFDAGFDGGVFDAGTDASIDGGTRPDTGRGAISLVINEIDYDQGTTDPAEFVEIYNAGTLPVILDGLALVLVNGTTIVPAVEHARATLSGTLNPGVYAVVTPSGSAIVVSPPTLWFSFAPAGQTIGDGSTDGVVLWDTVNRRVIDALSYEGTIPDATILAPGDATDVNLVEGTATPVTDMGAMSMCRRPNGTDTNVASSDWSSCTPSAGLPNP